MIRKVVLLFFILTILDHAFAQNSDYLDYIGQYKKIAIREMNRAGIPASIKLAQALLESNAGKSELARRANNHFGIKCGPDWSGKTFNKEDDDYNEFGDLVKSCFRKYKSAEDSYIAHSEFLRDPKKANRYGFLFRLRPTDYRRWAIGLRTSGYATSASYDASLIRIIETYKLYEYDQFGGGFTPGSEPEETIAGLDLRRVNDVKVVFAKDNITVQEISIKSGISLSRLKRYNEKLPAPNDVLAEGTRIFLQPKRCIFRGKQKWHYVQQGETLFDISQIYAVKLTRLHKRNRIPENAEPQANERIKLKGCRVKPSDRPRLLSEPKPTATVPPLIQGDDDFMNQEITPQKPDTQPVRPPATQPGTDTTQPDVVPRPEDKPVQPAPAAITHTVAKGDTLFSISRRYDVSVDELIRLNNLLNTTIKIGQILIVK